MSENGRGFKLLASDQEEMNNVHIGWQNKGQGHIIHASCYSREHTQETSHFDNKYQPTNACQGVEVIPGTLGVCCNMPYESVYRTIGEILQLRI